MAETSLHEQRVQEQMTRLLQSGHIDTAWEAFGNGEAFGLITSPRSFAIAATIARERGDLKGLMRCRSEIRRLADKEPNSADLNALIDIELSQYYIRVRDFHRSTQFLELAKQRSPLSNQTQIICMLVEAKIELFSTKSYGRACSIILDARRRLLEEEESDTQLFHDLNWWLAIASSLSGMPVAREYAAQVALSQKFQGTWIHDAKMTKRRLPALMLSAAGPFRPRLARYMLRYS